MFNLLWEVYTQSEMKNDLFLHYTVLTFYWQTNKALFFENMYFETKS